MRCNILQIQYGGLYTIHILHDETDEKGNTIQRLVPIQKFVENTYPIVKMVCVDENGEYTSTDSFKYCSRVIRSELKIQFDYHSLRHTHATILIENGANIKDVQLRLGYTTIQTTLNTYVHDTEEMISQSVEIFEKATNLSTV